jgi:hypothetical protein
MKSHVHAFEGQWSFDEAQNTAVFCCEHVFEHSRPILYVTHDSDGDWQFLCGDSHEGGEPRLVCLGCMVQADGSMAQVGDLPVGWLACREGVEDQWVREQAVSEQDEAE